MRVSQLGLEDIKSLFPGGVDLFVCSVSFENRCRSIAESLDLTNVRHALIAENENHIDLHGNNAAILARLFDNRARQVFLDTTDPLKTADGLETALQDYADLGCRKIVVDITTFTHEGFLIVFNLLRRHFDPSEVSYFYAGAREYSVGAKDSEKWLSKGIGEIRSVLGYSGRFLPSRKLHLITLVGFEHERVNELIRRYEPSVISLGYGESAEPGAEYHHPPNRIGYSRVKAVYANAREFSFYCYDPERTKQIIQAQVQEVPRTNVIVAAFNTKLSTMGVALAALEDDSIQLCYAQALTYNYSAYSRAGDKAYLIEEG